MTQRELIPMVCQMRYNIHVATKGNIITFCHFSRSGSTGTCTCATNRQANYMQHVQQERGVRERGREGEREGGREKEYVYIPEVHDV